MTKARWTPAGVSAEEWAAYLESLDPPLRANVERLVREQALDEAQSRSAPRATAQSPGFTIGHAPELAWPGWDPPPPKGKGRRKVTTRAVRVRRGEQSDWSAIGNDTKAVGEFVARFAEGVGYAVEEFVRPQPKGRLTAEERARRDSRARCAHELRERGATLEAIGGVLRVHKESARRLVAAGAPPG
jgi:hypothetical protein